MEATKWSVTAAVWDSKSPSAVPTNMMMGYDNRNLLSGTRDTNVHIVGSSVVPFFPALSVMTALMLIMW